MPSLPHTTVRGWRAALLLVAVACLSPGRAGAECGDYVTILNAPASHRHAAPQPTTHTPTSEAPLPVRPPCRGPNCSGVPNRELPPPAPAVPVGSPAKDLARFAADAGDPGADPGPSFDRDTTSPRPIRRASSVFHPPRLG